MSTAREGTGRAAAPENGVAGIKTGTAQTGVFQGEEELLHFWYSGFVWDDTGPRYCVTVLRESALDGQSLAAKAFQEVAQGLIALESGEETPEGN